MRYLLAVTVVFWVLFLFSYHAADKSGDNFGAVFPALFFGAASSVLTVLYVGLAFWYHTFW